MDATTSPSGRAMGVATAIVRRYGVVAAAFGLSRLLILAAAALAEAWPGRNPALTSGSSGPLLTSLTSWDGWWYLGIARDGYHAAAVTGPYHDYAFLPLYPALVRVLSLPWPAFDGLVAVILSNVLFLVALVLLVELGEPYLGRERSERAAVLLSFAPFGAVFGMAYAESLFLVLSIGAFLAVERRRLALAGALVALAALDRLQGALLILPLAILASQRMGRPTIQLAWLLLGPLAALGFVAYVGALTGTPGGFSGAQAGWGRAGIERRTPRRVSVPTSRRKTWSRSSPCALPCSCCSVSVGAVGCLSPTCSCRSCTWRRCSSAASWNWSGDMRWWRSRWPGCWSSGPGTATDGEWSAPSPHSALR